MREFAATKPQPMSSSAARDIRSTTRYPPAPVSPLPLRSPRLAARFSHSHPPGQSASPAALPLSFTNRTSGSPPPASAAMMNRAPANLSTRKHRPARSDRLSAVHRGTIHLCDTQTKACFLVTYVVTCVLQSLHNYTSR